MFGTRTNLPLWAIGMPGCSMLTNQNAALSMTTSAAGRALLTLPVPDVAGLVGARLATQTFVFDINANALGIIGTAGVGLHIGQR